MSLKAKLEAVIYAAEEPVTLNQLAALFAAEALEWKAAQEAAAAERAAEVAGEPPVVVQPLLDEGLEYLGLADTPAVYASETAEAGAAAEPGNEPVAGDDPRGPAAPEAHAAAVGGDPVVSIGEQQDYPSIVVKDEEAAGSDSSTLDSSTLDSSNPDSGTSGAPVDAETEAKRAARQRDREVKAVLKQLLDELMASSSTDGRGVEIREIAGGYRMATKPECHDAVRLFVRSLKPALKLSLPALETLAVVAYKQPVTAPEVNEIRGVESAGVLGSLLARKLIATAGRKQVIGRPILYKTTKEFLLRFGLKDVAELPSMEEFEKMAASELDLEPEVTEADKVADAADAAVAEAALEDDGGADLESDSAGGEEPAELEDAAAVGGGEAESEENATESTTEDAETAADAGVAETQTEADSPASDSSGTMPNERAETEAHAHAEES